MELLGRVFEVLARLIVAWWDFGVRLVNVAINIPFYILAATILTALPVAYFYLAIHLPALIMAYMLMVFLGVGIYTFKHWGDGNEIEDPLDGRGVSSETKAGQRSRSLIRESRHR